MAYRPSLARFPIEFEQLLCTAYANQPYTFTLETVTKANAFRMQYYTYLNALRVDGTRGDLIEMANALCIQFSGASLTFAAKESKWEAQAIRKALGIVLPSDNTSPAALAVYVPAAVQKLDALRQEKAEKVLAKFNETGA